MRQLTTKEIEQINTLNTKLIQIEKQIYNIAYKEYQKALKKVVDKEPHFLDYEIEVHLFIYGEKAVEEHLFADWVQSVKPIVLKSSWWGINDNKCHNTTSIFQKNKELNSQKHCSLLHELYDHYALTWDKIFKIGTIYFDVKIQYEYS